VNNQGTWAYIETIQGNQAFKLSLDITNHRGISSLGVMGWKIFFFCVKKLLSPTAWWQTSQWLSQRPLSSTIVDKMVWIWSKEKKGEELEHQKIIKNVSMHQEYNRKDTKKIINFGYFQHPSIIFPMSSTFLVLSLVSPITP